MAKISAKQLKIVGLTILLLPIALLLLFTIGETVSGDISGLGHLIQAAPLIVLAIFAWRKACLGGKILVAIASVLVIISLAPTVLLRVMGGEGMGIGALIGTGLLVYIPLIVSGLLFIASARKRA